MCGARLLPFTRPIFDSSRRLSLCYRGQPMHLAVWADVARASSGGPGPGAAGVGAASFRARLDYSPGWLQNARACAWNVGGLSPSRKNKGGLKIKNVVLGSKHTCVKRKEEEKMAPQMMSCHVGCFRGRGGGRGVCIVYGNSSRDFSRSRPPVTCAIASFMSTEEQVPCDWLTSDGSRAPVRCDLASNQTSR